MFFYDSIAIHNRIATYFGIAIYCSITSYTGTTRRNIQPFTSYGDTITNCHIANQLGGAIYRQSSIIYISAIMYVQLIIYRQSSINCCAPINNSTTRNIQMITNFYATVYIKSSFRVHGAYTYIAKIAIIHVRIVFTVYSPQSTSIL